MVMRAISAVSRRRVRLSATHSVRGFTLLELIIVIAIIGILAAIVMPGLSKMPRRAREAALKMDLRTLRDVIDQYYGDKGTYPKSLEALVSEKYLKQIPHDPLTKRSDTWILIYEEEDPDSPPPETDQSEEGGPGVVDVRSGAPGVSLAGVPYSEW